MQVTQIDDYTIDALYLGTTVRFQLFLTYENGQSMGRVICLNKYQVQEKVFFDFLGAFTFNPAGATDLPPNDHGEVRTVSGNADNIVIEFLDQAIAHGPKEFAAN